MDNRIKITGDEESLSYLHGQFTKDQQYELRVALEAAIGDAQTFGEAELDVSELSEDEYDDLLEELTDMPDGYNLKQELSD